MLIRGWRRIANLLRWGQVDAGVREELEFHLEQTAAQYERRGYAAAEARQAALRDLGGMDRWAEASRDTRGFRPLQDAGRDVKYAVRGFRRAPGFTVAAAAVLALGIGATTAVFSVVRAVLLAQLPYGNPDALYALFEADAAQNVRTFSYPNFEDLRATAGGVARLAYARGESVLARGAEGTQNLLGAYVTPEFFDVMGRAPAVGRVFGVSGSDDAGVVLSWRLSTRLFGNPRRAVGEVIVTPTASYRVIGVMPRGFAYPGWADMWLPLEALSADAGFALRQRNLHVDAVAVARVHDGVTVERAEAQLSAHMKQIAAQYPEAGSGFERAQLRPLREVLVGENSAQLYAVLGAVLLVLVIACVNVAGLLLARGGVRRHEMSVRLALGASRFRLLRQMLTESAMLGLIGGVLGAALAWVAVAQLRASVPDLLPRMEEIVIDAGALGFALGVSVFSALLFGMVPALRAAAARNDMTVRGTSAASDPVSVLLRSVLVIAQVGLAVVLLVSALLLIRTSAAVGARDLGFDEEGLIVVRLVPPREYAAAEAALALYNRLHDAAAAVPGVRAAAVANHVPLGGAWVPTLVRTSRTPAGDERPMAVFRTVSSEYLQLLRVRSRAGRLIDDSDARGTGVVVNRTLAEREWPGQNPIGQAITLHHSAQGRPLYGAPMPSQVVGVIEDVYEFGAAEDPPPTVYVHYERDVWPNIYLVVRAAGDPRPVVPALRRALQQVEPDIPLAGPAFPNQLHTFDEYRASGRRLQRFITKLLGVFAGSAVFLSLVGVFAVMAFLVAHRTREIGVRMALGARPTDAAGMVLRRAGALVGSGVLLGLVAAYPATRVVESLLFGVERLDAVSFAATALLFLVTAGVAAYLPARRASRVDPATALRSE